MATGFVLRRLGWIGHAGPMVSRRALTWAATISSEMQSRPATAVYDYLSPTPSQLLSTSLSDFVPPPAAAAAAADAQDVGWTRPLPPGHHLVYFPLPLPPSRLLADGTDPGHSPGPAFSRRLWAGGSVVFSPDSQRTLRLDGRRAVCVESIGDVVAKPAGANGDSPDAKVFVDVWRRYGLVNAEQAGAAAEDEVGRRPAIEERRTLVFMKLPPATPSPGRVAADTRRVRGESLIRLGGRAWGVTSRLPVPHAPDFSFTLTPSPTLLFHFSALTFNAHAIHLDRRFCREVEGHRGLLVHGPLSLTLLLAALRSQLAPGEEVRRIDYRNLVPLYADEPMKVCVRRSGVAAGPEKSWDVWAEGPTGGFAVRATASTSSGT